MELTLILVRQALRCAGEPRSGLCSSNGPDEERMVELESFGTT